MVKTYTRREARELLAALERQAADILAAAKEAEKDADKNSFNLYRKFRDKVSEFETFSIIVEGRLRNLDQPDDRLQHNFDRLSIVIFKCLIRASIKFLFVLSANAVLPLGAREIFANELRSMYFAKQRMSDPRFGSFIDEQAWHDMELAEEILNEVIDKAPKLLNFGP
ncbi:MAG: hypothetical protein OHK0024_10580 [Thalassobaculales bacterium]